ncbi:hypothetical protein RFI_37098, partial [Reticulomyxa filosa]
MLKMSMPKQSIINRMVQDKLNKDVIDAFEKTGELPAPPAAATAVNPAPTATAEDDPYTKYRKMLKMSMPKQSIINRMVQDKLNKDVIDAFEKTGELPAAAAAAAVNPGATPAAPPPSLPVFTAEEEKLAEKYRKM